MFIANNLQQEKPALEQLPPELAVEQQPDFGVAPKEQNSNEKDTLKDIQ